VITPPWPGATDPYNEVPPGTPNPSLAGVKVGWDHLTTCLGSICTMAALDAQLITEQMSGQFPTGATI
jgi:hypothetical protein